MFKGEIWLAEVLRWDCALAAAGRLPEVWLATAESREMTCALALDQGAEGGVDEGSGVPLACECGGAGDEGGVKPAVHIPALQGE